MRMGVRRSVAVMATGIVAVVASVAGAAPAEADLQIDIGASSVVTQNPPRTPNGGSVTVTNVTFRVDVEVSLVTLTPVRATIRLTLDERLRWGDADAPDPTEGCTSTPTTATCETPEMNASGQSRLGWNWPVTAPAAGSYAYRAEIVQASDTDPVSGNNASAITIVVSPSTPGPGPAPSPAPVRAGAVRLTPAKPKAGAAVTATVRVSAGGSPIRPSAVACGSSIGRAKLKGAAKTSSGAATCTFRPPRTAKGKTLRGSVSFTARGTRFTKRFSVTLR